MADIPEAVQRQLAIEERVVWCGRPRQGLIFRPIDGFILPLGLLWIGASVAAFFHFLSHSGVVSALPALLLTVPGAYLTWGRFLVETAARRGLHYAITDSRCLVVSTKWSETTRAYPRGSTDFTLVDHANGLGTIELCKVSAFDRRPALWGEWLLRFEQIPDAFEVYRLARSRPSTETPSARNPHHQPPPLHPLD